MRIQADKLTSAELFKLKLPSSVEPGADPEGMARWLRLMPRLRDANTKIASVAALSLLLPLLREDRDNACDVLNAIIEHHMTTTGVRGIRRRLGFDIEDMRDPETRAAYERWKRAHADLSTLYEAALAAMTAQDHPPVSDD